jgi:hypothetical protein
VGERGDNNNKLRIQIEKMKEEMHKVSLYSINIANDPASAIKKLSDPILDLMNAKVEDYGD